MKTTTNIIEAFKSFIDLEPKIVNISNESEYDATLEMLEEVLEEATDSLDDPLNPLIDMISLAIAKYESKIEEVQLFIKESTELESGSSLVRTLMAQYNLRNDELPEIGTKSAVSKIINNHRELTKDMIQNLSLRFNVNPAYFFNEPVAQHFNAPELRAAN